MAKERKASVIYEGNASQLVYAFPFDYLRKKFVKVEDIYTNITELTIGVDYTVEDKQVRLVKGIPLGHSVKIYRETPTVPLVEWQDASVLRSADMTLQELQLLHIQEEYNDHLNEELGVGESFANQAKKAAEEAKGYRDIAIAGQLQADWNEEDTKAKSFVKNKPNIAAVALEAQVNADWNETDENSKKFIKGKPTLNFIPQKYTKFKDYSQMSIISREANLENVPTSTYANVRAIKECLAQGKVDLSSTAHKVIDDVRLWSKDAALYINKASGWSGSNKFNHIYSYDAEYPFTLYCDDVTDTFLTESTFEEFRQGVRTNAPLTIQRCYFGDNTDFEVDSANPDCVILAKGKANVKVYNSLVSLSCRKGLASNCLIKFDSAEDTPATVYLKDCYLTVDNQNLKEARQGAIADLSNKNDRLIIDNCTFDVYPKRLHDGHSVMPYMLKPFKTVWSYNPFKSYLIGGKMLDVASFKPAYQNMDEELYPTILETENGLKNPFGGNLVKLMGDFYLTYHVPKELVGTVMYAHIYICDCVGNNPTLSYEMSDGTNIKGWQNEWCKKGEGELGKLTPYLNIFSFIPTKEIGKFTFHNTENTDYMVLAGAALVQDINKNKLCDYAEAYQE